MPFAMAVPIGYNGFLKKEISAGMTLELGKVGAQIDDMGRVLVGRARHQQQVLPAARELLHRFADKQQELALLAESELGKQLRCACPNGERLDAALPCPAQHEQVTVIASDGSQVFPDQHGFAFFYLVNVGSIVFRQGSGQPPAVGTNPRLYYRDEEVYPDGVPASSDLVAAIRNLAEVQELASLGANLSEADESVPCLSLIDGPLLIWVERAAISEHRQAQILADYFSCLDRLQQSGAALAGFVSRPQSAEVVALLVLAHHQSDPSARERKIGSLAETEYRGLTDRALFGYLPAGQRSALFIRGTAANEQFRARGHRVYFFYLNTGADLARVEVPQWVALDSEQLDLVHSAICEQCRVNNGYPYVLTRADEQAVILGNERELLEGMIIQSMMRNGLSVPELSRKAQQKQVARWRRVR